MTARPEFKAAWAHFAEVYKAGNTDDQALKLVADTIGGKVKVNIDSGEFLNACPIRVSYFLNRGGVAVPGPTAAKKLDIAVVSGSDHSWYMFRVKDAMILLARKFGVADKTVKKPKRRDFAGKKGIMAIVGHGWQDATGHITLWDGTVFSDKNHLSDSDVNGTFVPEEARLWVLPA